MKGKKHFFELDKPIKRLIDWISLGKATIERRRRKMLLRHVQTRLNTSEYI